MGGFDILFQFLSKGNVEELNGHTEQKFQNLVTCDILWACPIHFMSFIKSCFSSKIGTGQVDFSLCSNELHVGTKSLCFRVACISLTFLLASSMLAVWAAPLYKGPDSPCGLLWRLNCFRKQDEFCHWETNSLNAFMSNILNVFSFLKNS